MQSLYHTPQSGIPLKQAYHRWSVTQGPIPSLTPPFQSGEYIRPRAPWHPWRLHQITVEGCHLIANDWLIEVHIQDDNIQGAKVLADDFELVKKPADPNGLLF